MRRRVLALAVALAATHWATGAYVDVLRADAAGDLPAAREAALAAMREDPAGADAAAAAVWWLRRADLLPGPAAPLELELAAPSPELAAALAELEGELERRPPAGTLATVELSGPFGVLDTLDIERGVVPPDGELPPEGPPHDDAAPWRLTLATLDGWAQPPRALLRPGVYLAAWTFVVPSDVEGWMVLEADAAADVAVDGRPADRVRPVRRLDATTRWYRVRLPAGRHRVRVAFASRGVPRVRLRLLDLSGAPLAVAPPGEGTAPGRPATVRRALPPPEDALATAGGGVERALVAAALAGYRGDWVRARRALEAAPEGPGEALVHLELARLFLERPTGGDDEVDRRRAAAELDRAGDLPGAVLLRHRLAATSGREEDAERLLEAAQRAAGDDPRVVLLALERAIRLGWSREIEDGLEHLEELLGPSPFLADHRLDALDALDQVAERNRLLERLAVTDPLRPGLVDRLLDAARLEAAVRVLRTVTARSDDLDAEIELVQLLLRRERPREALDRLRAIRARWGAVARLDQLELVAAGMAGEPRRGEEALERLLAERPGDLSLRTLAWSRGARPFYEPFVRDPVPLLERARREAHGDVDAVLVLDQAVERVFPDGTSVHYYHGVTLALTPEGARQAADLNLLPDAELLTVRILHPDGTAEVPADLSPRPGARLEHVEPGDAVETEYVAAIPRAAVVGGGHLSPYIYRFADADRAFGLSEYTLLVPPGLSVEVEGNLAEVEVTRARRGGLDVITYRVENAPPRPSEPFAPPEQELLPWVTYGFGVTWEEVGDLMRDRTLAALAGSPELAAWAAQRLAGGGLEASLRAAVDDLVDRVRPGSRDLDLDTTAGAAFARGEGDRLGILLAALLERPGWRVDLVLSRPRVYAGSHLRVPTTAAFGVPLVRVSDGAATVWVDLAEERRGVGHIRAELQGSDGLVLPLDDPRRPTAYLKRLPEFPNPDLEERVTLRGRVREDGSARLTLTLALRGRNSLRLLDAVRRLPEDRVQQLYARVAASLFPGALEVRGRVEETAGEAPRLVLEFTLERACEPAGEVVECRPLVLAKPLSPALASLPERRYPLVVDLPVLRRYTVELELPEGWVAAAPPRRLEAPFGTVRERLEASPGRWRSVLTVKIPAVTVPPPRYPEFARFVHAVDELVTRPPRFSGAGLY